MSKLQDRQDILVVCVVGLFALLAINYAGDYLRFFAQQDSIQSHTNILIKVQTWIYDHISFHEDLDHTVESNMRVVDQLIGIILRDDI